MTRKPKYRLHPEPIPGIWGAKIRERKLICVSQVNLNASNGQNWVEKAGLYTSYYEYDEAIKCMDKAIELDRSDAEYWYTKGFIYFIENKYNETIECCDEAIKLDPSYSSAWVKKAIALKRLGKYEEALE